MSLHRSPKESTTDSATSSLGDEIPVALPWSAWFNETTFFVDFPPTWQVEICKPNDADPMTIEEIALSLDGAEGAVPLKQAAAGHQSAVIVVEDLTRPTPVSQILPLIIERLREADIHLKKMKVLIALGAHGPLSSSEVELKVGKLPGQVEVVQHDPEKDLVEVGETRRKTSVSVSRHFAAADFKVSIGSVLPHPFAGFSGGAKLIMPGVAGIEALKRNHRFCGLGLGGPPGKLEGNAIRSDIEESARLAGLDWVVDCLVNSKRQIVAVFSGRPEVAHQMACQEARRIYRTEGLGYPADVLILNAFPKDTELLQLGNSLNVLRSSNRSLVKPEGLVIVCAACPRGTGKHRLFEEGGSLYVQPRRRYFRDGPRMAIFSPGISFKDFRAYYGSEDSFFSDWADLRAHLATAFPDGGRAAVFPAASLQIFE